MENRFYEEKKIKEIQSHPLQFTVWRFSAKSRIIVDLFSTLILAIILHNIIRYTLDEA